MVIALVSLDKGMILKTVVEHDNLAAIGILYLLPLYSGSFNTQSRFPSHWTEWTKKGWKSKYS